MRRYARRRDANEPSVIAALEAAGAVVQQLDGDGLPDLLVSFENQLDLIEVKRVRDDHATVVRGKGGDASGMTPMQTKWWSKWKGRPPHVVENAEEALAVIGARKPSS